MIACDDGIDQDRLLASSQTLHQAEAAQRELVHFHLEFCSGFQAGWSGLQAILDFLGDCPADPIIAEQRIPQPDYQYKRMSRAYRV